MIKYRIQIYFCDNPEYMFCQSEIKYANEEEFDKIVNDCRDVTLRSEQLQFNALMNLYNTCPILISKKALEKAIIVFKTYDGKYKGK